MTLSEPVPPKRGLLPLGALVLVFALPTLAAWFFYLNPDYLPSTRSNRGELLQPQVPLGGAAGLTGPAGAAFDLAALDGRWTLVTLESNPCADACRERLIALRQIRLALGESQFGVERLLVLTSAADTEQLTRDFPGLRVALATGAAGERLLAALGGPGSGPGRLYIRDPLGNLMLRYAPDAPAQDTLKDLERLLKASKNWIKGGTNGHR